MGIYPKGEKLEFVETTTKEEFKGFKSFIPCEEALVWQEGQIAWFDWNRKVHVGTPSEILEVMKIDLPKVRHRPQHYSMLSDMIKKLESEIKSLSS